MSKIKTFSFFIVALLILITITYFLNKKEVSNNGISNFIEESINSKSETDNSIVDNLNKEEELLTSDQEINDANDIIEYQEENEDNFDSSLYVEEESLPSTEEDPIVTETRKLNQTADIAKNYVLNNQLYIDDKGFNLEIINVIPDACDDCWTAELSYRTIGLINPEGEYENYFKNITLSLQNEEIKEVIWEGQALDINE